jgi:hypothetical protein
MRRLHTVLVLPADSTARHPSCRGSEGVLEYLSPIPERFNHSRLAPPTGRGPCRNGLLCERRRRHHCGELDLSP